MIFGWGLGDVLGENRGHRYPGRSLPAPPSGELKRTLSANDPLFIASIIQIWRRDGRMQTCRPISFG